MSQIADTEQFQRHRPHLAAVAYRMLGSVSEADDALQEAWLRVNRSRQETIHNARAWLTTIVGRVCIDMLRARQSRREDYVGSWVPEPIVTASRAGDFDALLAVLDPDVVFRAGGGPQLQQELNGATDVVRRMATIGAGFARVCHPAIVNGQPGLLIKTHRGPLGAIGFTVTRGLITTIELTLDPDKLEDVDQLLGHPRCELKPSTTGSRSSASRAGFPCRSIRSGA